MLELVVRKEGPDKIHVRLHTGEQSRGMASLERQHYIPLKQLIKARSRLQHIHTEGLTNQDSDIRAELETDMMALGHFLGEILLQDTADLLGRVRPQHLSITLSPDLLEFPWELMYRHPDYLWQRFPLGRMVVSTHTGSSGPKKKKQKPRALVATVMNLENSAFRDETQAVADILAAGMDVKTLDDADKDELLVELTGDYDIIHLIGHREALAAGDKNQLPSGTDFLSVRAARRGLLFMNVCGSADAENGIPGACVQAGYSHFIGTQWSVEDQSAGEFAKAFYQKLMQGKSVGESVQKAKLEAHIRGAFTWANYVLYGDPRIKIVKSAE
jgi:CHAT domain-containing protein